MGFLGKKVEIPGPSGVFAVGICSFDLIAARPEPFAASPAPRKVPVIAYYPALASQQEREPALDEPLRDALSDMTRVPKVLLRPGQSHAVRDAAAAPGRYPVVLFNHGLGSFQKQSASLLQDLASHGFVVLSIGHPFESLVVQHGDGTVVRWRKDLPAWKAVEAGMKDLEGSVRDAVPLLERARQAREPGALREAMVALAGLPGYAPLPAVMERWADDTRTVLGALSNLPAPPLTGLVDSTRVGVLGHSLGGMVSGLLAMTDPRVRCGMNFDGAQLPVPTGPYALAAPFCFVYADTTPVGATAVTNEGMNDALAAAGPPGSCGVCIVGSAHLNFTDMNNLATMAKALGRIDRGAMARTLRALTAGFFQHHLEGRPLTGFAPGPTLRFSLAPV
ncbi:MAG: hypothetical protein U0228_36765 [Myxococcaceae bacterium]